MVYDNLNTSQRMSTPQYSAQETTGGYSPFDILPTVTREFLCNLDPLSGPGQF